VAGAPVRIAMRTPHYHLAPARGPTACARLKALAITVGGQPSAVCAHDLSLRTEGTQRGSGGWSIERCAPRQVASTTPVLQGGLYDLFIPEGWADPFANALLKIERANKHISDIEKRLRISSKPKRSQPAHGWRDRRTSLFFCLMTILRV
jgi:hypothetical protein